MTIRPRWRSCNRAPAAGNAAGAAAAGPGQPERRRHQGRPGGGRELADQERGAGQRDGRPMCWLRSTPAASMRRRARPRRCCARRRPLDIRQPLKTCAPGALPLSPEWAGLSDSTLRNDLAIYSARNADLDCLLALGAAVKDLRDPFGSSLLAHAVAAGALQVGAAADRCRQRREPRGQFRRHAADAGGAAREHANAGIAAGQGRAA